MVEYAMAATVASRNSSRELEDATPMNVATVADSAQPTP